MGQKDILIILLNLATEGAHHLVVGGHGVVVEANHIDVLNAGVLFKVLKNGVDGDFRSFCKRETIGSGGDGGESDGTAVILHRKVEGFLIALTEKLLLVGETVVPNGTDGVDYVLRVKLETGGDDGVAGFAYGGSN